MIRAPMVFLLMAATAALAEELPVPPSPPDRGPASDAAPVPNLDAQNPATASQAQTNVQVQFYRSQPYQAGVGFAPGSRYRTPEDRKPIQTPGLSVSVPLP